MPQTQRYNADAYAIKLTFSGQIPILHPDQTVVTVYQNTDYHGAAAALGLGNYSAEQLDTLGVRSGDINSAQIVSGYEIVAYDGDNFTGNSWTLNASNSTLSGPHHGPLVSLQVMFDPTAYFEIINVANGMVLDGNGANTQGSDVIEQNYTGSATQQWQVANEGPGVYAILNRASGFAIDGRGSTTDGTPLGQWQYDGSTNLQWAFGPGQSNYKIVNQTSGLVIDSGGNVPPGSNAGQWYYDGSSNLQWRLVKIN
jgi:alpha-L-fucosidase